MKKNNNNNVNNKQKQTNDGNVRALNKGQWPSGTQIDFVRNRRRHVVASPTRNGASSLRDASTKYITWPFWCCAEAYLKLMPHQHCGIIVILVPTTKYFGTCAPNTSRHTFLLPSSAHIIAIGVWPGARHSFARGQMNQSIKLITFSTMCTQLDRESMAPHKRSAASHGRMSFATSNHWPFYIRANKRKNPLSERSLLINRFQRFLLTKISMVACDEQDKQRIFDFKFHPRIWSNTRYKLLKNQLSVNFSTEIAFCIDFCGITFPERLFDPYKSGCCVTTHQSTDSWTENRQVRFVCQTTKKQ